LAGKRDRTETQSFGVSKREGHDSSKFYARKIHGDGGTSKHQDEYFEQPINDQILGRIFCKSSEKMDELPDSSVQLMVTSPPYNVGKEYDQDLTMADYRQLLRNVFKETKRVLVDGGRVCVNVANLGRKPYIPLHTFIIQDMLDLGFLMRGEVIWNKSASSGTSTAWGSWQSASNPTLRDTHEYIMIFSKGSFSRPKNGRSDTIKKEEFLAFTKSVWDFPAESARKVGHPAPFPIELPYRCMQLYTYKDDVALDPFCGVGSSCLAAIKSGRRFIGYDINPEYVNVANKRAAAAFEQMSIPQLPAQ
jgi:modification methylase